MTEAVVDAVTDIMGSAVPILAAAGFLCHLCWLGVRRGWETMAGLDRARQSLVALRARWARENEAYLDLHQRVEEAQGRLAAADERAEHVRREIAKLERAPPCFIHTLGSPGTNHRPFRAEVSYDAVAAAASRAVGRPVNPVWRQTNRLLIHAADMSAARREAERMFPQKGGYATFFHAAPGR